jgi:FkbM family methyltransferase
VPLIEFQNVSKAFSRAEGRMLLRSYLGLPFQRKKKTPFYALKDVSFAVERGESVAVIGHNGAGKSTLLSLVARLTDPDEGRVIVDGRVAPLLELGVGFHGELTGAENVRLNASLLGLSRQHTSLVYDAIVEFADIGEFINAPVRTYSAGMILRLAFSVAVHCDPEVLLVDEVLVVGDQTFQAKCLDKIKELRAAGKTLLCVSHSAPMVMALCDRAIWLDHGRLVRVGPAGEVLEAYSAEVTKKTAGRIWIAAGTHAKADIITAAKTDANLRVYALEPDPWEASRSFGRLPNLTVVPMTIAADDAPAGSAPATRLDTLLDRMELRKIDHLKVDGCATAAMVPASAGRRLGDIAKISVVASPGDCDGHEMMAALRAAGFGPVSIEEQPGTAADVYSFLRPGDFPGNEDGRLLLRAGELAAFREPAPEPGWHFDCDWDNPDAAQRERRSIWEHFRSQHRLGAVETVWIKGIRLISYLGNDLSKQLFISGRYEPNEFALLDRILKPGMVFVDAGANEGLYTLFAAAAAGNSGKVLAFEPSPRDYGRLRTNCELNDFPAVRLFRMALSDSNGMADFGIATAEHAGQNLLGESRPEIEIVHQERVQTMRLDDVPEIAALERLDILKIDVEGEEYRLLRGAEQSIRKHRPVILFECSTSHLKARGSSPEQVWELLGKWEYDVYGFDPNTGGPVPVREQDNGLNLIAAPSGFPLAGESGVLRVSSKPRRVV